jgi:FlaG/FlaF family flagellin (archaellin)
MKSFIQAVAIAVVLAAPVASFAQSSSQPASQGMQAVQAPGASRQDAALAGNSGYGSSSRGTWQAGQGSDTTVSSYSPPIHNVR